MDEEGMGMILGEKASRSRASSWDDRVIYAGRSV